MDSGRVHYKNKAQIEKEVQRAQHKLMDIFFKSLEDKMEKEKPVEVQPVLEVKPKASGVTVYNRFNDDDYTATLADFTKAGVKHSEEDNGGDLKKTMNEDPLLKNELSKYNYSDLVDLNRDFQFYINHPDKFKKINKAKLKIYGKRRPTGLELESTEFGTLNKENSGYGLMTQSRDIIRNIEQSRAHGFMSQKERRRLLKNLF
jgi:hypothetical protein